MWEVWEDIKDVPGDFRGILLGILTATTIVTLIPGIEFSDLLALFVDKWAALSHYFWGTIFNYFNFVIAPDLSKILTLSVLFIFTSFRGRRLGHVRLPTPPRIRFRPFSYRKLIALLATMPAVYGIALAVLLLAGTTIIALNDSDLYIRLGGFQDTVNCVNQSDLGFSTGFACMLGFYAYLLTHLVSYVLTFFLVATYLAILYPRAVVTVGISVASIIMLNFTLIAIGPLAEQFIEFARDL